MILNLVITYENILPKDIVKDLNLRTKNTNILDCYFYDEDGLLVDITGATLFFTIKDKASDDDASAKLSKTITSLTDPASGNAEIEITSTDSEDLLGNYLYDIKIKLTDGEIYTLAEGNICFSKNITIRES